MKNINLKNMQPALHALGMIDLHPKAAYRISRAINQSQGMMERFARAEHALYQEFGTINAEGTQYVVPPEKQMEFQARMQELYETEIPTNFLMLKLSELVDKNGEIVNLKASVLAPLDRYIITGLEIV